MLKQKVMKNLSPLKKGIDWIRSGLGEKGNYLEALRSSWMANLGVVPLLALARFLLLPWFFLRLALLVSLTFVLETICYLQAKGPNPVCTNIKKIRYLPIQTQSVKSFLLKFFLLCQPIALAQEPQATNAVTTYNVIVSIGEHREIETKSLQKFSIGNNEIISHQHNPKNKVILIKGKKLGFTELIIWNKDGAKDIHRIYVLSKQSYLKILHLAQTVKALNLEAVMAGPLIVVKGELDDFNNYLLLKKIHRDNKDHLHLKGHLHPKLRNFIIGDVYAQFFEERVDQIRCVADFFTVYCYYSETNPPSPKLLQFFQEHYYVKFIASRDPDTYKNYRIKLKLIQIERLDGHELHFGLDQLGGSLSDFFNQGVVNIALKNKFLLNRQQIHLSTLAEPESVIQLGHPTTLEVGAEIPFHGARLNSDRVFSTTEWKFAGLRIKLQLGQAGQELRLNFNTELTNSNENADSISGNKESSIATIRIGEPFQLFQIGYKTTGQSISSLPLMEHFPILGELFKSKSTQDNYKKITGVIVIEDESRAL